MAVLLSTVTPVQAGITGVLKRADDSGFFEKMAAEYGAR